MEPATSLGMIIDANVRMDGKDVIVRIKNIASGISAQVEAHVSLFWMVMSA